MNPTAEQSTILDFTTSTKANLMINALAGTGKSATLKLIDKVDKTKPALYLVFNKRNQLEALEAQKANEFASTTEIKTFNGCGYGIWRGKVGPLTLDKVKSYTLWRRFVSGFKRTEANEAWKHYHVVMDGMEKAKAMGYVPTECKLPHEALATAKDLSHAMDERPCEDALDLINDLLMDSIKEAFNGLIDFNDQIYMPACFGGNFPKFPRVMVDEYQDQNAVNHRLIERLVGTRRLIGVGDPFQNIYGFRGAKANGMTAAVDHYTMHTLPLSVSFRCPQAIVEAARWRVPHFQWSNPGGSVATPSRLPHTSIPDDATIICRNNAPLLRVAFRLLSAGRSVSVAGSDLGPRLIAVMKKLGDAGMSRKDLLSAIEFWREERLVAGSKSASDLADCMRIFAEHGDTLGSAISYAEHIFVQRGAIALLTIHKSKGLEFPNVYLLDPFLMDDREQDLNLKYVAITRSAQNLTILDSAGIVW